MSDQRYPLGRTLTQFSDNLSKEQWNNPTGPGEWRDITEDFKNILSGGNAAFIEENRVYLDQMRRLVVNNFDFAITALELFRDFLYLFPNFLAAIASYIASFIYNTLDAFLRLGLYVLVIPPNLKDWGFKGLPTTSLQEQTEIAYKKFYDVSDENIPYYLPYSKNASERLIDSGDRVLKQYEKYYLNSDNTEVGASISERLGGKKNYIKSDYINFQKSLEDLSRPLGLYDALFLYFAVDFNTNAPQINKFLEAIATMSNFFQFENLWGVHEQFNSLFAPMTKKVKILSNVKIPNIEKSFISPSTTNYDKKDLYSVKRNPEDNELKDIYIFPADPVANMPQERKDKLMENLRNQGYNDESDLGVLNTAIEDKDEVYGELFEFNLKDDLIYQSKLNSIKDVKSEIIYYSAANFAANLENTVNVNDVKAFYNYVDSNFSNIENFINLYGATSSIYETSKFNNLTDFVRQVNLYKSEVGDLLKNFTTVDENGNPSTGEPGRDLTNYNLIKFQQTQLLNSSNIIRNEYLNITDVFSITPPNLAESERLSKLEELEQDVISLSLNIEKKTLDQIKAQAALINENLQEKKEQLDRLNIASTKIENITNSANVIFYHNSYPLAGQNSLYKNYIQKFYNFTAQEAQNYVYEFTVKIEEKPGANNFQTNFDYIQPSQYVQVAKYNGTDYDIIADGIVMEEEMQPFNTEGGGTWAKLNFSDLIGITGTIKALQNSVRALERTFLPNTEALDAIINFLKSVKSRILELIDIIDTLLELLNFSINFEGVIWGKYCRETGLEGYDKLAADLTSTQGYNKKPTTSFRPSENSTIAKYLSKIKEIDSAKAESIKNEIDSLFTQTSNHDEKDIKIEESSQISLLPDRQPSYELAKTLGQNIQNQIDNMLNIPSNIFSVGSSLYTNLANIGIEDKETAETSAKGNKVLYYYAKIYAEIAKIKPSLSSEFGFSMVFLSYLPKGMGFYPVRHVAWLLQLLDQNGNSIDGENIPLPMDEDALAPLIPNNTLQDLENILAQSSKDQNPSSGVTADPQAIKVNFIPFRTTESFQLNNLDVLALSSDSNYFSGGISGSDYAFTVKGQLNNNYIHGVFSDTALKLPKPDNSFTNDFKYRFEFELAASFNNGTYAILPEINKINVYMGVLFDNRENIYLSATKLNDDTSEIFKFGRRKKRKFIGEISLGREETSMLRPYILIGYDNGNLQMESLTFTITNSEIYFYRVQ